MLSLCINSLNYWHVIKDMNKCEELCSEVKMRFLDGSSSEDDTGIFSLFAIIRRNFILKAMFSRLFLLPLLCPSHYFGQNSQHAVLLGVIHACCMLKDPWPPRAMPGPS